MELRLRCFQLKWYVKMKYHTLQPVAGKFEIPTVQLPIIAIPSSGYCTCLTSFEKSRLEHADNVKSINLCR
jgi:hypothetical protein